MKKILITGANSFVGINFMKYSKYKYIGEVSLYKTRPEDIDYGNYDVILHLAALVHQTKRIPDNIYYEVNRDLCLQIAELAKKAGIKQFVFLSSLKVYGEAFNDSEIRNEDSKCFPDDAYGKSKYEAEIGLRKLENTDFTISVIRPPLIYGDRVKANMLSLLNLIKSFPFLPFGKIYNKRNFVYTENLVGFIDRIIENRASGTFIAKDKGTLSTTELVIFLSKFLGKKVILFKLPKLIIRVGTYFKPGIFESLFGSMEFDNSKTINHLSYSPPFSTEEGIKKWLSGVDQTK
jgi:nucleoside-diphosphate-sugar epimerase